MFENFNVFRSVLITYTVQCGPEVDVEPDGPIRWLVLDDDREGRRLGPADETHPCRKRELGRVPFQCESLQSQQKETLPLIDGDDVIAISTSIFVAR